MGAACGSGNKISAEGACHLAEAFKSMPQLHSVDFTCEYGLVVAATRGGCSSCLAECVVIVWEGGVGPSVGRGRVHEDFVWVW